MNDIINITQQDLVLNVDYNSLKLDLDVWDDYLDCLCGNRYYQKDAIKTAIKYLAGDKYKNLNELAKSNYKKNMQEAFPNEKEYLLKFSDFGDKLFANIDLATATGKSYVMYGIAQIMLSLGLVDKVLLLCPSLTIEDGLTEKFIKLAGNRDLLNNIPNNHFKIAPTITNANHTVFNYSICIENVHSVYEATKSSIHDNFFNNGNRVLVLNDESHHIFNKLDNDTNYKKWISFLLSESYGFNYILGFTGTAYQNDNYFLDVIYRYSLKQASEDGFVKNVEYIEEQSVIFSKDEKMEKFQIVYEIHEKNKKLYKNILKPLTILITKDTQFADNVKKELIEFLIEQYKKNNQSIISEVEMREQIEKTVLKITHKSSEDDKKLLKEVDNTENKIEWIIGVSMLNEGWDVKNVFQIVPMEEKAFNSKLLIAQVLGRGLRKPENTTNPKVIVSNHESWGKNIKHLVNEVLELEKRIEIGLANARNEFNFSVHNIDYTKEEIETDNNKPAKNSFDYSELLNDGISLVSQAVVRTVNIDFEDIKGEQTSKTFQISSHTWTIEEILDKLYSEFAHRNWEGIVLKIGENLYSKESLPSRETLKSIIKISLDKRGINENEIIDKNAQRILSSFSTILRKSNKKAEFKTIYNEPKEINSIDMKKESYGISNFRRSEFCLFHTENYEDDALNDTQRLIIDDFINGGHPYARRLVKSELFKTCSNYIVTTSAPEKKFVEELIKRDIAILVTSWIKSKNRGFYSLDYSKKVGSDTSRNREYKIQSFNPDFFIKASFDGYTYILVNEIKQDKDISSENKAKYKYAKKHFNLLNDKLEAMGKKEKYIFHMLSPQGYASYFEEFKKAMVCQSKLFESQGAFRCELELELEDN